MFFNAAHSDDQFPFGILMMQAMIFDSRTVS